MTDDLITWLRAQLDADERIALAAPGNRWIDSDDGWVMNEDMHVLEADPTAVAHIARHDPARELAEVDAKRRILDEHKHCDVTSGFGCGICAYNGRDGVIEPEGWCTTVRLVALPSADRPGYRAEWAVAE